MKIIIDRFEGEYAVVEMEDKTMVNIPRILLKGAKEGDVVSIEVDKEGTVEREKRIKKLMDDVWE